MIEPREQQSATKERILDTAERLFAQLGFSAASLRAITAEAGVNLAAVNYHFHSKDELIHAVFSRRIAPINAERLRMLEEAEARAGDGPPQLEEVIAAFISPVLQLGAEAASFKLLMGRMFSEPREMMHEHMRSQFGSIAARFLDALQRALPELEYKELIWRIHFLSGAMAHTLAGARIIEIFAPGVCDFNDTEGVLRRIVAFVCAGMRAPVPGREK